MHPADQMIAGRPLILWVAAADTFFLQKNAQKNALYHWPNALSHIGGGKIVWESQIRDSFFHNLRYYRSKLNWFWKLFAPLCSNISSKEMELYLCQYSKCSEERLRWMCNATHVSLKTFVSPQWSIWKPHLSTQISPGLSPSWTKHKCLDFPHVHTAWLSNKGRNYGVKQNKCKNARWDH